MRNVALEGGECVNDEHLTKKQHNVVDKLFHFNFEADMSLSCQRLNPIIETIATGVLGLHKRL